MVPGGHCSQGCHEYSMRLAQIAHGSTILLGTIPQAHLLSMSSTQLCYLQFQACDLWATTVKPPLSGHLLNGQPY